MFFEEPLQHNPIGTYVPSSGWRFLIFNNLALLDLPGECVCVDLGDGQGGNSARPDCDLLCGLVTLKSLQRTKLQHPHRINLHPDLHTSDLVKTD